MDDAAKRTWIDHLFDGLRGSFLEGELILGGSSGFWGFPTNAPAYAEDIESYAREDLVAYRGGEVIQLLAGLGYQRQPDTPTFIGAGRPSFDLIGYSTETSFDHLSPSGPLQVMVFGDLGLILACPESVIRESTGRAALSPAGFATVKLMTVRVEKGAKDKLQALLVIAERAEDRLFQGHFSAILRKLDPDACVDALADAQIAFMALRDDATFRDQGAERYIDFLQRLEMGYQSLVEIMGDILDA